jgi:hypothetical protein
MSEPAWTDAPTGPGFYWWLAPTRTDNKSNFPTIVLVVDGTVASLEEMKIVQIDDMVGKWLHIPPPLNDIAKCMMCRTVFLHKGEFGVLCSRECKEKFSKTW